MTQTQTLLQPHLCNLCRLVKKFLQNWSCWLTNCFASWGRVFATANLVSLVSWALLETWRHWVPPTISFPASHTANFPVKFSLCHSKSAERRVFGQITGSFSLCNDLLMMSNVLTNTATTKYPNIQKICPETVFVKNYKQRWPSSFVELSPVFFKLYFFSIHK